MRIEIIPLRSSARVRPGDDVGELILGMLNDAGVELRDGDVVVVSEKVVAKAEGRLVRLAEVVPGELAKELAAAGDKDARVVELVLRESKRIVAARGGVLVVETKQGFVCANAGVDLSNVEEGYAKLLPEEPDESAERIRRRLEAESGRRVGVVVADSWGRPFRLGSVGVAIGCSGIAPLADLRGRRDLFGRELRSTVVAVADCIASAANLVMGEAAEGTPAALVRGLRVLGEGRAKELLRPEEEDVFRFQGGLTR